MNTKLTNMWRRKERQNRYAKKREVEEDLHALKINCKGKRTVEKANKRINVVKKI